MSWTSTKAIQGLLQFPKDVPLGIGVTRWWAHYGHFIVGELGVAESVLAVTLFEHATFLSGHGSEEAQRRIHEDRGVFLALLPHPILQVAKDDNAGLRAVGGHVLIALDGENAHGRDGFWDALGQSAETLVLLERDLLVRVTVAEAILLFKVGVPLGGAVNEILVEGLGERWRASCFEGLGGDVPR